MVGGLASSALQHRLWGREEMCMAKSDQCGVSSSPVLLKASGFGFFFIYIVIPTISNKEPRVNIYFCALASAAANVAEFAAPAAPVLLALLHGTLLRREAEAVERLTADLTKYHLRERGDQVSHTGSTSK